jgi:hypothetical protein
MGRRRRHGNRTPQNNSNSNSIEDSAGNEENGYPVPECNKVMINVTKEPSHSHKIKTQRENLGRNC